VAVAAAGTALAGLGVAGTATFVAIGALLLYAGFVFASGESLAVIRNPRRAARRARRAA
jgi:hypothetical protein